MQNMQIMKRAVLCTFALAVSVVFAAPTLTTYYWASNETSFQTCNPQANRLYIHLLVYPGQRLSCAFPNEVACARFLHDGSEIQLERHGAEVTHLQEMYKTGCEGVSYFKLPAMKPDVTIPVIEVVLSHHNKEKNP